MTDTPLVSAVLLRRVSNGFVLKAFGADRATVDEQAHNTLEDAVDAVEALAWSGKRDGDGE